jgi:hypothetical protein
VNQGPPNSKTVWELDEAMHASLIRPPHRPSGKAKKVELPVDGLPDVAELNLQQSCKCEKRFGSLSPLSLPDLDAVSPRPG